MSGNTIPLITLPTPRWVQTLVQLLPDKKWARRDPFDLEHKSHQEFVWPRINFWHDGNTKCACIIPGGGGHYGSSSQSETYQSNAFLYRVFHGYGLSATDCLVRLLQIPQFSIYILSSRKNCFNKTSPYLYTER